MIYLKTSYACDLYSIKVETLNQEHEDISFFVCGDFSQETKFRELADDVHKSMIKYWKEHQFRYVGKEKYWYVTLGKSSQFRKIHIIKNKTLIENEENTYTCRYNYFLNRTDAQGLLQHIKDVFLRHGIEL